MKTRYLIEIGITGVLATLLLVGGGLWVTHPEQMKIYGDWWLIVMLVLFIAMVFLRVARKTE